MPKPTSTPTITDTADTPDASDPAADTADTPDAAAPSSPAGGTARYHHGDLRRALIDAAVAEVAINGPAALSLRALAAEVGVSHAAPIHHFGDKAGLFTAVAIEGCHLLADELSTVWAETGDFLEVGVRYVHFALAHKGHFEVMFRPDLLDEDDPGLAEARQRAFATLHDPLDQKGRARDAAGVRLAGLASWAIVHGLATLALSGNLPDIDLDDPDEVARRVLAHLQVV